MVEPSPVTFRLKPGGRAEQDVTITNRTNNAVRFTKWESSCNCLTAVLPHDGLFIEAGEKALLRVVVNMGHDPEYVGSFGPEIRFLRRPLTITVDIEVVTK